MLVKDAQPIFTVSHNEELGTETKPGRLKWAENVSLDMRKKMSARFLAERQHKGQRGIWEDNIKIDRREIGYEDGKWMERLFLTVLMDDVFYPV